jgi:CheY-like chemotaxis protein
LLPQPEPDTGAAYILVVEDEVLVRALIAEELRAAGCAVAEAGNADAALDYIRAGGRVDLVFSDVQMPGSLNGLQFAERVRVDYPGIPVILTSGNSDLRKKVTIGAFVPKPYDIAQTVVLVFATLGLTPRESET